MAIRHQRWHVCEVCQAEFECVVGQSGDNCDLCDFCANGFSDALFDSYDDELEEN